MIGSSGGSNTSFTFRMLILAMVIMTLLPMLINFYSPTDTSIDEDEVLNGYYEMTGQTADTKVSVWPLTGIYLPYSGGAYGYTDDGWLYGSELKSYAPSQYQPTNQQYIAYKDDNGMFRYYHDSADYNKENGTGHRGMMYYDSNTQTWVENEDGYPGDLYTSVSFDVDHKSNIFFSEATRVENDEGFFFYDYDGYRMAFQPISNYTAMDADGNKVPVIATTTSLSLIWYQYYTQSGVAGQLVLSGSSSGISYINAAQILSAFNNTNNIATFPMVFNGVTMNILIKIDSFYLSQGWTVQECYDGGFWSIMVTSLSADSSAYTGTDYSMNPAKILQTIFDLFTFNYSNYNMAPWIGAICSIIIALPLYAMLLSICVDHQYLYILVGVLAALQALSSFSIFG